MNILSIIIPCYNEQKTLYSLYCKILNVIKDISINGFEIIFIDDGSTDNSLKIIKNIYKKDPNVKYISFSRNFGKESAIFAGLKNSKGDFVAILDADFQDPPELLVDMYNIIINQTYDCVAARRISRKGEPIIRSIFSKHFYTIINNISKVEIIDGARDYRMMSRAMVNSILEFKECVRFSKGIFSWTGYKTKWLEYENIKRENGKSKWSFCKLFFYSLDAITSFSSAPLAIASILGFILCIISFILILFIIIKNLIYKDPVSGYPSMICIIIFLGSIQLFCTGILGQYLSKIFLETKKRPLYIIKESTYSSNDH